MSHRQESPEAQPHKRSRRPWRRAADTADRTGSSRKGQSLESEASEQERIITEALADLRDMDVREVMTPRVDVTYLTIPVHTEDIARAVWSWDTAASPWSMTTSTI